MARLPEGKTHLTTELLAEGKHVKTPDRNEYSPRSLKGKWLKLLLTESDPLLSSLDVWLPGNLPNVLQRLRITASGLQGALTTRESQLTGRKKNDRNPRRIKSIKLFKEGNALILKMVEVQNRRYFCFYCVKYCFFTTLNANECVEMQRQTATVSQKASAAAHEGVYCEKQVCHDEML